jgi:hypothetical protein
MMSEDVVNNPKHYNKQGIEVIEVIEAYTPNSPHLANVLKYVCRCEYKGKKLQDLKKASWYLDRAIVLLEAEEAEWTGLSRDQVAEELEGTANEEWTGGYSGRDVEVFFQGYDCRQQEEDERNVGVFHSSLASRIAGDTVTAQKIKDEYYGFDRFEIQGYCACCDAEINKGQPYITSNYFDAGLKFCKQKCVDSLRAWQKDWKAE